MNNIITVEVVTVEEFFQESCSKYLNQKMLPYINDSYREDFINKTIELIKITQEAFIKNGVNSFDKLSEVDPISFDEITTSSYKIPFWFNETSENITVAFYVSLEKYIEKMAQTIQ